MDVIRTVRGDISPDELGICYPHEHLIGAPPDEYAKADPDLVLDDENAAVESLRAFKTAGGSALIEMTPLDYHRNPSALARIAQQADIHILAVTGYLKEKFNQPFVEGQTVDQLTTLFIREIQDGMDETSIRAGVIKASSSLNTITECERKVFIAAAQAQQETGVLISTHTESGTMALEQITLLTSQGVSPDRILIGHLDRRLDADYHQQIAQTGVFMGFDQIGKPKYATEQERIAMIKQLIASGHERQLMLSMDIARRSYLPAYGGKPGFTYLLEQFVPLLYEAGMPEATVKGLLSENPARALTLQRRA